MSIEVIFLSRAINISQFVYITFSFFTLKSQMLLLLPFLSYVSFLLLNGTVVIRIIVLLILMVVGIR